MSSLDNIFTVSPHIRYVALYRSGQLTKKQREGWDKASAAESDRYEELIVNPTLLTLVRQRGNIDCGGARFIVVGYGNFLQLVIDLPDGHVSVCFQLGSNPIEYVDEISQLCSI